MNKIISVTDVAVNNDNLAFDYHQFLADNGPRDAKWDLHRSNTQSIEALYSKDSDYKSQSKKMHSCSQILAFSKSKNEITGKDSLKLRSGMFCQLRHCPVCGWRRQLNNFRKAMQKLPEIQAEHGGRWIFLTLTVKNPPMHQLRDTLKQMTAAWTKIIKRKSFPAMGYVRATEITKGDDGRPHPHFHILLHVSNSYFKGFNYWSKDKWANAWQDVMKLDYSPITDVRIIKPKKGYEGTENAAIIAAAAETIKYAVKVEDMMSDANFLYGITDALHNLRFIGTGGTCQGLLKDEATDAELIGDDDDSKDIALEEQPSVFYGWSRDVRKYKKSLF